MDAANRIHIFVLCNLYQPAVYLRFLSVYSAVDIGWANISSPAVSVRALRHSWSVPRGAGPS